ncbi:alpha/beta fold hydrolase [Shimia sp. R11_0]|uniref:alpha/beta hydrolase n=1 Tax=Shimia sp. R11_0 TaxID=2821096 RepID=UPI001ADD1B3E|nr:alpha/beta fold hydrolase [Shimia sp. R11_0]MBO9479215.1 alpha/beta fold hydrolase [Shimia sp. R11_0]
MRRFGKLLGRSICVFTLAIAGLVVFGPYEDISIIPSVRDPQIGEDVEMYFTAREARFADLTPGVEKRVVWAGEKGQPSPLVIVYVHGFSATSEEIRPVPDLVAERLGANLVYTRLQGHGRDGAALDEATVQGWANDVDEALAVARYVGEEIVVIATSTGGTVVAAMSAQSAVMKDVKGLIFVSPNFGINSPLAWLLTWPAARYWVPMVAGAELSFEPRNAAQAKYWTTSYPSTAVLQMAALVAQVRSQNFGDVKLPALFWFSDEDKVVEAAQTRKVASAWGGPVELAVQNLEEGADPNAHVIAGAIMSPNETLDTAAAFVKFITGL